MDVGRAMMKGKFEDTGGCSVGDGVGVLVVIA